MKYIIHYYYKLSIYYYYYYISLFIIIIILGHILIDVSCMCIDDIWSCVENLDQMLASFDIRVH